MAYFGIVKAFAVYGAELRSRMWSVSAWTPGGELVVSQWAHHSTISPDSSITFSGSTERWAGHGAREFRANLLRAFTSKAPIRLVLVSTRETEKVDQGADASKLKKGFAVRPELVGEVVILDADRYAIRFRVA